MEDERKKYIDCLLADFSSLKEEIRRRATLQRFVLVGFLTVLAFTFKEMYALTAAWTTGLWVGSSLALLFYSRESLEIRRLGCVIRCRLAVPAARSLGVGRKDIFHSETNQGVPQIDPITKLYNRLFKWVVFLGLPTVVTFNFIRPVLCNLGDKAFEHPLEVFLSFLAVGGCLYLLLKHAPLCKRAAWVHLWQKFVRN